MPSQNNPSTRPSILALAIGDDTPRKALLTAVIVGTILTAVNHGEMVFREGYSPPAYKIILTYLIPYCVTTWGAVTGKIAHWKKHHPSQATEKQRAG